MAAQNEKLQNDLKKISPGSVLQDNRLKPKDRTTLCLREWSNCIFDSAKEVFQATVLVLENGIQY